MSCRGELVWGQVLERAVRPDVVGVSAPVLDLAPGILEVREPMLVEALVSERAVESLDEGIVDWLARMDEA